MDFIVSHLLQEHIFQWWIRNTDRCDTEIRLIRFQNVQESTEILLIFIRQH